MENKCLRDLIFDARLYTEYPYILQEHNEDGTTTITFSKVPILKPSLVEEKLYANVDIGKYIKEMNKIQKIGRGDKN